MSRAGDDVLTLHPARLRRAASGLCSVAVTVGAIALLDPDGGTLSLVGMALAVIVFGSFSVASIWELVPGWSYMRIGPDGLAFKGVWRTSHQAWDEIDRFVAFDVRAGYIKRRLVGYILREADADRPSAAVVSHRRHDADVIRKPNGNRSYAVTRAIPAARGHAAA